MPDNLPATSAPARTLGEFACGLTFEHIPAAVLERAKLLILDALGCGIASNAYGFSDAALAGATALGGVGRCSVIGRANRLPVRDAALVNGMLIHGLDFDDTIVAAQGIAASTASGVQVFLEEGAWTKRMHPGWAAVAGITAARLAQHGFKAPTRSYEGKFGFFDTHLQHAPAPIDLPAELATLGSVWELAETAVKPYPVCHFIHGCADAAIDLHEQIDSADIVRAEALLPRDTMPIVAEPHDAKIRPANEYEAKFSAQFVVATCLLKGAFGLADLMPAALKDPAVLDLAARVTCTIDPDSAFPTFFSGGVRLQLRDGRTLFRHVRVNSGAGERALDTDGMSRKFLASATLVISRDKAERIRDAVLTLENHTAVHLASLLRTEAPSPGSEKHS